MWMFVAGLSNIASIGCNDFPRICKISHIGTIKIYSATKIKQKIIDLIIIIIYFILNV